MGATERWIKGFDADGLPIVHEENDGARFLRRGAEACDYPLRWRQIGGNLLREAILDLAEILKKQPCLMPGTEPAAFKTLEMELHAAPGKIPPIGDIVLMG